MPRTIISQSRTISPLDATFLFPFDATSPRLIMPPRRSGHARFVRAQENAGLFVRSNNLGLFVQLIFRYARINIFDYICYILRIYPTRGRFYRYF